MSRRIFCLIMATVTAMAVLPCVAAGADVTTSGTCGENLTWVLDNEGTLTISGTGETEDYQYYYLTL